MWGKPTGHFKSKWHPAIAIASASAFCLISAWIVLGRSLSKAPTQPTDLDQSQVDQSQLEPKITQPSLQPTVAPSSSPPPATPTVQATIQATAASPTSTGAASPRQGVLRVSNPTDYPIRVALLAKKSTTEAAKPIGYDLPAHWDFAPQEGATKGLVVSLPDRTLKVKQGDVLVAFAQDGSRRYWGPYVVGETEAPTWMPKAKEWELVLQP